jgi:lipoprotein-anchoring transpeptidase ErfK/SrfK
MLRSATVFSLCFLGLAGSALAQPYPADDYPYVRGPHRGGPAPYRGVPDRDDVYGSIPSSEPSGVERRPLPPAAVGRAIPNEGYYEQPAPYESARRPPLAREAQRPIYEEEPAYRRPYDAAPHDSSRQDEILRQSRRSDEPVERPRYDGPRHEGPRYGAPRYEERASSGPHYGAPRYEARPDEMQPYEGQPRGTRPEPGVRPEPYAVRPPSAVGPGQGQTASLPNYDDEPQARADSVEPRFRRRVVSYQTREPAGTIIIDTANTYLYLVMGGGQAMRYGIGVGRDGFTWAGREKVSRMAEWPDWHPPAEMIERQPYLPRFMAGGPGNPLGARALYLGKTIYRIHGTNEPHTIGKTVSSGCIRLLNEDVEDLYGRVQVGTKVVVLPQKTERTAARSTR